MFKKIILSIVLVIYCQSIWADIPILDNATTSLILDRITANPVLARANVSVTTQDGVVILEGDVPDEDQATLVIQTAQSATGVKDVDASKLKIAAEKQLFNDVIITAKIKGRFLQAKLFGSQDIPITDITVSTTNGIVSLGGVVPTTKQADIAIKIAKSVTGVKVVESTIKVVR